MPRTFLMDRAAGSLGYAPSETSTKLLVLHHRAATAFAQWQVLNARYVEASNVCHATKFELREVDTPYRVRAHRLLTESEAAQDQYKQAENALRDYCSQHGFEELLDTLNNNANLPHPHALFAPLATPDTPEIERIQRRRD